jgi:hypothetical protein
MTKKLPIFKDEREESEFFDNPENARKYFEGGEEVEVDFSPAREELRKKRIIEAGKLRRQKAAG